MVKGETAPEGLPEALQDLHSKAVRAFKTADSYHLIRPKYTPEATRHLLHLTGIMTKDHQVIPDRPLVILELGCGTGLLTDTLTKVLKGASNVTIYATDPLESMREEFQRNFVDLMKDSGKPKLEFRAAIAENLSFLEDGSVDAIVAGASYHWFANQDAYREIARVLRTGGKIGYITNLPEEHNGPVWCQELWKLLWEAYGQSNVSSERAEHWRVELTKSGFFTDVMSDYSITNFEECDMETCIRSFTSYSMVQAGSDEVRKNFEDQFRKVMHNHFTAKGVAFTGIPYIVDIHHCEKK